ncbi:MAG TPA: PfkB family carbohydrate kinase, partial [Beijerinckiaceae bacterium]
MGRIYVAGETILDLAPRADGAYEPALGGSAFNAARALGRLGAPAGFLGALSSDPWGQRFRAAMEAAGVDVSRARVCDAPTALALVSPETARGPSFTLYLAGTTHDHALPPEEPPADAAHLHAASVHALTGDTGAAMLALMRRAQGRVGLSFDPNVRPASLPPRAQTPRGGGGARRALHDREGERGGHGVAPSRARARRGDARLGRAGPALRPHARAGRRGRAPRRPARRGRGAAG